MKIRLDAALVGRGLVRSRAQAADLIRRGQVRVNGAAALKPAWMVAPCDEIELARVPRYVSRGGEKLEAALRHFQLPVAGGRFLDVGASTGGFTDCLLQHGARAVVAVDVGQGQLDAALRADRRVEAHEGLNIRDLPRKWQGERFDGVVMDVSFISLRLALPPVLPLIGAGGWLVALVKPQFECGPAALDKRGVVRKEQDRLAAAGAIRDLVEQSGCRVAEPLPSPITGGEGNQEFLLAAWKNPAGGTDTGG